MKKLLPIFSSFLLFFNLWFGSPHALAAQPIADFSLTGTVDPTAVATNAKKGTLYFKTSGPQGIYQKTDNGTTTSWVILASNGGGSTPTGVVSQVAYYDATTGNLTSPTGTAPNKLLFDALHGNLVLGDALFQIATASDSVSVGNACNVGGTNDFCEGATNHVGLGFTANNSHAEGSGNTINGNAAQAHVEGTNNTISSSGSNNHIMGASNNLSGTGSNTLLIGTAHTVGSSSNSLYGGNGVSGSGDGNFLFGNSDSVAATNNILLGTQLQSNKGNVVMLGDDGEGFTMLAELARSMKQRFLNGWKYVSGNNGGPDGVTEWVTQAFTNTTTATLTTLLTLTPTVSGQTYIAIVYIVGTRLGVLGNTSACELHYKIKNVSGTVTVSAMGVLSTSNLDDITTVCNSVAASGTDVTFSVQGVAAQTYRWAATAHFFYLQD